MSIDEVRRQQRGRIPPHDLDAEESLVGAMLLTRDAVDAGLDVLEAEDLYTPRLQAVFRAVARLHALGSGIDVTTVAAELDAVGRLGEVGGREALLRLQAETPASANARHYAGIVRSRAVARRAIDLGHRLSEAGYELDDDGLGRVVDETARLLLPAHGGVETRLLDLEDLAAMADADDEEPTKPWLIPSLFRVMEVLILTGGEGWGKATLLRQIGVALASGIHPLALLELEEAMPAGPQRVLYVDLQEDEVDMAHELRRLRLRAGRHYRPGHFRAVSRPQGMDLLVPRDRRWLESLIDEQEPALVCMGPLVRMFRANDRRSRYSEDLVDEVTDTLDELRTRYRFALMLEGHAGNERDGDDAWRVRGSSVWRSWPTFGVGLKPVKAGPPREVELKMWRGPRHAGRPWPKSLLGIKAGARGWPWRLAPTDYDRLLRDLGLGYLLDGAQTDPLDYLDQAPEEG